MWRRKKKKMRRMTSEGEFLAGHSRTPGAVVILQGKHPVTALEQLSNLS